MYSGENMPKFGVTATTEARKTVQEVEARLDKPSAPGRVHEEDPTDISTSRMVELWNVKLNIVEGVQQLQFVQGPRVIDWFPEGLSAEGLCDHFAWMKEHLGSKNLSTSPLHKTLPQAQPEAGISVCSLIVRQSFATGFTSYPRLGNLLSDPPKATMVDFFHLTPVYPLLRRHDRGTCQPLPVEYHNGRVQKRYIIQTPFYKKGFWSLVLHCDMADLGIGNKTCGVLHTDADIDMTALSNNISRRVKDDGPHPLLLPLELFLLHFETTAETFQSVLTNVADVDTSILSELARAKSEEASQLHRDLLIKLHTCSMDLAELARRTTFEEELAQQLVDDLESHANLKDLVELLATMSKSRGPDVVALPGRIESLRNVLYSLITQHDSYLQARLARASLRDSKAMKTLSILTILFLPGAFIATVFSTEMFVFESAEQQVRIYFAITIPLTVCLMVGWALWLQGWWPAHAKKRSKGTADEYNDVEMLSRSQPEVPDTRGKGKKKD